MIIRAISDTHGFLPTIEPCDLFIHAGDICPDKFAPRYSWPDPDGQLKWLNNDFKAWWQQLPCSDAIATWGNHDLVGEHYTNDNIHQDEVITVAGRTFWVSPWSNRFGGWAFMKHPQQLIEVYEKIPTGVDIIISHQPPFGYGDEVLPQYRQSWEDKHVGSSELLHTIEKVKPKAVICGHIHSGWGKFEHKGIPIYNVAHVDDAYKPIHAATLIDVTL